MAGVGIAPSVVNQVLDTYNGLSQLTGEYQEHNGAVNTATSPEVQYAYIEMSGGQNNSRPISITYPNGRKIDYLYSTGVDSNISRLSSIVDDSAGTTLEAYTYLGLATIVQQARPQANTELTYIQQTGETNLMNDGGDQYTGVDRFGRVVDQNWAFISAPSTSSDRFQYGYDRAGNVLYKNNLVSSTQSELYRANSTTNGDSNTAYDPLGRMTAFARGTLSSSGHDGTQLDTISTTTRRSLRSGHCRRATGRRLDFVEVVVSRVGERRGRFVRASCDGVGGLWTTKTESIGAVFSPPALLTPRNAIV
jgi:hypothetical protein